MAEVRFTQNLAVHVECAPRTVDGATVGAALAQYFVHQPKARSYVLDEQGALRKHVTVFVDGVAVRDRTGLSEPVQPGSSIYVMQALSGG